MKKVKSSSPVQQEFDKYHLISDLPVIDHGLHILLEALTDVVFSLDGNACFNYLNSAWEQYTGYVIDDCLGQRITNYLLHGKELSFDSFLADVESGKPVAIIDIHQYTLWFDVVISKGSTGYQGVLLKKPSAKKNTHTEIGYSNNFRQIAKRLNEAVFQIDSHGHIEFVNLAWIKLTGYRMHESLGKPMLDFVSQHDQAKAQQFLAKGSSKFKFECRLNCKNAEFRWVSMVLTKMADEDDENCPVTGFIHDLSEHKQLEQMLLEGKERYALLASSTTDGIWDWDLNTDQVYFSSRWKSMLGYTEDEIVNEFNSWHQRVHVDDIEQAMADVTTCLEGTTPRYENIHRMQHRDGSWVWVHDRGTVLRNEEGLAYRMVGSHTDVTLLKRAEQALLEQERELQAIVSGSPDGIVTVTRLGAIRSINQAFIKMTGLDEKKLIGIPLADFENCLEQVSSSGRSKVGCDNQQRLFHLDLKRLRLHPFACKRGSEFDLSDNHAKKARVLSLTERLMFDHSLEKIMYFRDITVESEVDNMKSEFLSTAAHELRTPMASVFGFSELLLTQPFDEDTTREIVTTIHQQSQSLVDMLNQLLDLARIESRMGLDFNFSKQFLWPIVKRSIEDLLIYDDIRKVKFSKPESEYIVDVDADKLRQVISNVLVNAYKYSPYGGDISLFFEVRKVGDSEREVGITIQDHGLGMSAEQLSHIYERFWRADTSGLIPGTGLGMALVKDIMDIHQGHVDIKSEQGVGTTVTLWLKECVDDNQGKSA